MKHAAHTPSQPPAVPLATNGAGLAAALPYVQALHGQRLIIVYAHSAIFEPAARQAVAQDVAMLTLLGAQPLLVHGGIPQLPSQGAAQTVQQLALPVMRGALGEINRDLVQQISRQGIKALGLSGQDGQSLRYETHVAGTPTVTLTPQLPDLLLQQGILPVLMPVVPDDNGQDQLLPAEWLGAKLAPQLNATTLVLLLNAASLRALSQEDSPTSRQGWEAWLQQQPAGPLATTLRAVLDALANGVRAVHLLDAEVPGALLGALLTEEGGGLLLCQEDQGQWLANSQRYFRDSDCSLRPGFRVERKRVVRF